MSCAIKRPSLIRRRSVASALEKNLQRQHQREGLWNGVESLPLDTSLVLNQPKSLSQIWWFWPCDEYGLWSLFKETFTSALNHRKADTCGWTRILSYLRGWHNGQFIKVLLGNRITLCHRPFFQAFTSRLESFANTKAAVYAEALVFRESKWTNLWGCRGLSHCRCDGLPTGLGYQKSGSNPYVGSDTICVLSTDNTDKGHMLPWGLSLGLAWKLWCSFASIRNCATGYSARLQREQSERWRHWREFFVITDRRRTLFPLIGVTVFLFKFSKETLSGVVDLTADLYVARPVHSSKTRPMKLMVTSGNTNICPWVESCCFIVKWQHLDF